MTVASDLPAPAALRQLVDGVSNFLGLLSPQGRVLYANRAALALIGAGLDDVHGRAFADTPWFPRAADREAVAAALARIAAGGHAERFLVQHTARADVLDVELQLTPVADGGRVVAITATGRDVTAEHAAQRARERSERLLAGVVGGVPDAIVTVDAAQTIRMANRGAEATFGYARDELVGQPLDLLLPEAARPRHAAHVRGFGAGADDARYMSERLPISGRRRDGTVFPAEVTISRTRTGDEMLFTAVLRDLSDRQRTQRELDEARQHEDAILRAVADGVIGIDRDGRVSFVNPAAARLLGYRMHELIGRDLHALVHHTRPDGTPYPVEACPTRSSIEDGELATCDRDVYWRADGTPLPVEYTSTPFRIDGRVEGAVIVFRDISARKRAEAELLQLSLVDELTGLYNRRGFLLHAGRMLQRAHDEGLAVTLAFVDMDRFKSINDTHGHLAGDQALREVATLLRRALRRDDVLGRFGGDEFIALLAGRPEDDLPERLQARIEAQLAHRNAAPETAFALAMSVGTVRVAAGERRGLDELLAEADAALYRRKRERRATPG